jgi:hypothetical protein
MHDVKKRKNFVAYAVVTHLLGYSLLLLIQRPYFRLKILFYY